MTNKTVTLSQIMRAYEYANGHPDKCLPGTTNWLAAVAHSLNEQRRHSAEPTLAELQATVARLETQLNRALNLDFERRAEIERVSSCPCCLGTGFYSTRLPIPEGFPEKVRCPACKPYPEQVMRECLEELRDSLDGTYGNEYKIAQINACLDKVKELNQ